METAAGPAAPLERLIQPVPAEHRADPYPYYSRLRAEDPVHRAAAGFWILTRYDQVREALRDPRLLRADDELPGGAPGFRPEGKDWLEQLEARATTLAGRAELLGLTKLWMVNLDPPRHPPLRRAAAPGLAAAVIERMRPRLREIAHELAAAVTERDRFDLVADFAQLLPARVVCELLGLEEPAASRLLARARELGPALAGDARPEAIERAGEATLALARGFRDLLRRPGGPPAGSLLARFGAALPESHAVAQAILVLFAGQETTAGAIANGFVALERDPAARARLTAEPELLPTAVEELLRFDGPVQFTLRVAGSALAIGGHTIARGDYLALGVAAANHDPERFTAPDRLDLARSPNHHLGFGHGSHACLGAALARAEAEEAFAALFAARPGLRLASAEVEWRPGSILRGPVALPVVG